MNIVKPNLKNPDGKQEEGHGLVQHGQGEYH